MKEKIKQLIADQLMRQGQLKLILRNLAQLGELTDELSSEILDEISKIEMDIETLKKVLEQL